MNVQFDQPGEEGLQWLKRQHREQHPHLHEWLHNCITDMGLSTTSSTVKEKDLSFIVLGRVNNFVKGKLLLMVEVRIILIDPV